MSARMSRLIGVWNISLAWSAVLASRFCPGSGNRSPEGSATRWRGSAVPLVAHAPPSSSFCIHMGPHAARPQPQLGLAVGLLGAGHMETHRVLLVRAPLRTRCDRSAPAPNSRTMIPTRKPPSELSNPTECISHTACAFRVKGWFQEVHRGKLTRRACQDAVLGAVAESGAEALRSPASPAEGSNTLSGEDRRQRACRVGTDHALRHGHQAAVLRIRAKSLEGSLDPFSLRRSAARKGTSTGSRSTR